MYMSILKHYEFQVYEHELSNAKTHFPKTHSPTKIWNGIESMEPNSNQIIHQDSESISLDFDNSLQQPIMTD